MFLGILIIQGGKKEKKGNKRGQTMIPVFIIIFYLFIEIKNVESSGQKEVT